MLKEHTVALDGERTAAPAWTGQEISSYPLMKGRSRSTYWEYSVDHGWIYNQTGIGLDGFP